MKRSRVLSFLVLPLLVVLAVLAFLGLTERGGRELARAVVGLAGGVLTIDDVQGRLLGTWQVDGLRVRTSVVDLHCKKIRGQLQPLALVHGAVRMVALRGEGIDVGIKEEGFGNDLFVLPELLLPVAVVIDSLEVEDLFIHGISGLDLPPIERAGLELAAEADHVRLKRFEATISGASAHMQGSVGLGGQWPLDLRGAWRSDGKSAVPLAADFLVRGVVTDLVARIDLQTPMKTRVNLACSDPFNALRWQADTTLAQLRLTEINPEWPDLVLASADLRASGTTDGYQGSARLTGGKGQLPQARIDLEFSGDFSGLAASLVARFPEGAVKDKDVQMPREPGTQGRDAPVSLAPRTDEERLAGAVTDRDVQMPREPGMAGAVTDRDVQMPREPGMAGAVTARGILGWQDELRWQVELEGKDLNPEPYFPGWKGSVNAGITGGGRLQGDDFSGEIALVALNGDLLGYPLAGNGSVTMDGHGVQVHELLVRSGESELTVTGTVGAMNGDKKNNPMDLNIELDVASLGNLLPEAAGRAHLQGSVQSGQGAPKFFFALDAGELSYQDNVVESLTGSGQGVVGPQGEVEATLAAKGLRAGATAFSSLAVDVGGTVARHLVQAKLTGAAGDMDLVLAGGLAAKSWQGEVSDILLRMEPYGQWQLKSPAPLRIDGKGVDLASTCIAQGEASLCLQGGWQSSGNGQGGSNAAGARDGGSGDGQWRVSADLDSFPCGLLSQWHLFSRPVAGNLTAFARITGVGARLVTGEAGCSVPELQIPYQDEDGKEQVLRWTDNLLTMQLVDSQLVSMAKARFQDGTTLDAMITIGQFGDLSGPWARLPMQGEIGLDIKDLAPVAILSNYIVKPTGSMKGTFAVQGQVGDPRLSGELRQTQGNVFIPATGITLEDLLLSVMVRGEGEGMHLVLDAVSGPGKIRIAGDVSRHEQNGWSVDAVATGKEFEVAHLSDYEVLLDPDLHLMVRKGVAQVNGTVLVPRAVITIKDIGGSVAASPDVVLLDAGEKEGKKMDLPLSGSVIVELGEDVNIDAFGLKGRLLGSVTVNDGPGLPMTGKGSLTLQEGIYVVRDRALDIARGRFFFLGGPLENPGIDVLAQKKNKNKTVGVMVSGTVNDMDLKLFSDPPQAESQVLTELLAGRSYSETSHQVSNTVGAVAAGIGLERGGAFVGNILSRLEDQFALNDIYVESGEKSSNVSGEKNSDVSVMIGKELSKDLYISYGYDPFAAAGIFKARYDLWKGFSVETEVGAEKTGADLLWSIEK